MTDQDLCAGASLKEEGMIRLNADTLVRVIIIM